MSQRSVLFGAAYYHEYQPYERLDDDLDLMVQAGFSMIRVGESVWSTWEPEDGVLDLDWLAPVLDGAHRRNIGVIVGTPTYAVPPWLWRKYPEIAGERRSGEPIAWGARQEVDFTHPAYLFHAERVVRAVVARYASHPAVLGFQVDNEPGFELLHNNGVFEGFVDDLRHRYGDVETLNREWGLTHWSHRLSRWDELWRPDGNLTPSYTLAWRRYQARLVSDFIGWQADIVRTLKRDDQFVTTCISYGRPAVDDVGIAARLDVTAANIYFATQDTLTSPPADGDVQGHSPFAEGVWRLYLQSDRARASAQGPFLVTETNATTVGASHVNYPAYDGQLRQAAWAQVARGAQLVEYWHWHTLHHGHETYWSGVLGHSLQPGRTYAEVARIGSELARAGTTVTDLRPDIDVGFVYSVDSKWAFEAQPPLPDANGQPDPRSYDRIFRAFYQGAFDAGLQAGLVAVEQLDADPARLARRYPSLVAPALYIADDATIRLLDAYADAGGHLLVTARTGYADAEARARAEIAPGGLRAAVGAHYLEYTNLTAPIPVQPTAGSPLRPAEPATATAWADGVIVDDAEPLVTYLHPHLSRWPAVTSKQYGRGRVTYVGTVPDAALAKAVAAYVAPPPVAAIWGERAASVTVTSAINGDGRRVWFIHNWSWEAVLVPAPVEVRDVLSGTNHGPGDKLELGSWDVRVLEEAPKGKP